MILVLKQNPTPQEMERLLEQLTDLGVSTRQINGKYQTALALIGDTAQLDAAMLQNLPAVESVKRISEPYQYAGRKSHPNDTIVELAPGVRLGGKNFQMIAGPCSVESDEQLRVIARAVKAAGASLLRGGAFKPRTSPYAFQGLREEGIRLLLEAKRETGLPVVSEITDAAHLPLFEQIDVLQVGARNMQNFELLKELGRTDKPILLKRGMSNTLQELLMSAEYLLAGGNHRVILCERGIRTFETATRNTLDLSAVALLRELTHLPVIVDPSHATGNARLIRPMALAAVAAGADGLMIEVHHDPAHALCDGAQALTPPQFEVLAADVGRLLPVIRSMD
ncbi:MAG: 3-deoxy-7-phosphoheptulonate synthase [Oscillospiraceae bacterium]